MCKITHLPSFIPLSLSETEVKKVCLWELHLGMPWSILSLFDTNAVRTYSTVFPSQKQFKIKKKYTCTFAVIEFIIAPIQYIHSFIYTYIQQMLYKYTLSVRHCAKLWGSNDD